MHIGRCLSPTRRTRFTVNPPSDRERGVVRVACGERAARGVDGVAVVDVDEPDRVPPAAVDIDAAPEAAVAEAVRDRFGAQAARPSRMARPRPRRTRPGEVAIVPSSAAALTLMSDRLAVRSLEDDLPRRSKRERVRATGLVRATERPDLGVDDRVVRRKPACGELECAACSRAPRGRGRRSGSSEPLPPWRRVIRRPRTSMPRR